MLFLARVLHLSSGEQLRNMVVRLEKSCVKEIYSFAEEAHSMVFVDDIFLSSFSNLKKVDEIKKTPHSGICEGLYAYRLDAAGELALLGC